MRTTSVTNLLCGAACAWIASACSFLSHELPSSPPPLFDLEEPLALIAEPQDEAARVALPPGSFSGVEIAPTSPADASRSRGRANGARSSCRTRPARASP